MRRIVITVDYEIFGNGTGDVRQHMIEPTARMAEACESHNVPFTVFFEVEEYLAFVRHREALVSDLGYDPAAEIREQIRRLAARGHDIQLHLHPQWYGARYASGTWTLRPEVQTVDDLMPTDDAAIAYIAERQRVIHEMLADVAPAHRVCAYRAGAFSAQPGQRLIRALEANGFVFGSSVVHGLQHYNSTLALDYRHAPAGRRAWRVRDDVAREDTSGSLWEVPIYSVMGRRFHQLTPRRLLAKFSRNVPKAKQREMLTQLGVRGGLLHKLRFLWQPVPIKLDHDNLSPAQLMRWIRNAPPPPSGDPDVLILIGHSKEHIRNADFRRFVGMVAAVRSVEVTTCPKLAEELACLGKRN